MRHPGLATLLILTATLAAAAADRPPNILPILSDDQGRNDLGASNLDRQIRSAPQAPGKYPGMYPSGDTVAPDTRRKYLAAITAMDDSIGRVLHQMFWHRHGEHAARMGNWKLVPMRRPGSGLYDLSEDIGEQNDLSTKMPDVVQRVRARYEAWRQAMAAAESRGPFRNY